jgi:multidrug efflux pump subunit AcrA (membrane-fusion protein)
MAQRSYSAPLKAFVLGGLLPLGFLLLGVGAYLTLGKSEPKQVTGGGNDPWSRLARLPAVQVERGQVLPEGMTVDLDVTGVVVPYRQVTLATEVAGRVLYKSENCRIGRFVEEGELLFRLDTTDYQLEVDRLTALRESEYAQQKELDQEVANGQRLLELAQQDVELQEKELARLQQLPEGFASATELDQSRRSLLNSSNQKLTIQNQLQTLETRRTRILLAEQLAATQLGLAKVNLARCQIVAPISGVIVAEMAEQSSYIQKGSTLCVIDDTRRVEVSCNLRSDQLMLVLDQRGSTSFQPAGGQEKSLAESYELPPTPVTIDFHVGGRDESVFQWEGRLSRYEGIGLDPKSRTVPVRITVDQPRQVRVRGDSAPDFAGGGPPALVQGMFIDCHIHTQPRRPLMLLPKLALRPGNQAWIFVDDPNFLEANGQDSPPTAPPVGALSLEEWVAGKVCPTSGLRPIRLLRLPGQDAEYWVSEMQTDLSPETKFVISPVAGFIGDGSDQARHRRLADD